MLRTLPDTPSRAQRELDMQLMLGRALAVVKGFAAQETGHAYARALIGQAPLGVPCFARAALTPWRLGYPDQALARSAEMLALAQELADAYNQVRALVYAADVHHLRREWCTAQERAEASLALSTEKAFVHWVGPGTFWRGWALAAQGQGEEGVSQMRQGLAARQATGNMVSRAEYLGLLAEAEGRIGQAEAGLCLLAEALVVTEKTGARYDEAELYRIKGELLLRQAIPDEAQAAACFRQALAAARRQQAKSWELRAAVSWSRLWQRQGQRVNARALLAPIYGWFTEGFDTADLQEAKALLEELS